MEPMIRNASQEGRLRFMSIIFYDRNIEMTTLNSAADWAA